MSAAKTTLRAIKARELIHATERRANAVYQLTGAQPSTPDLIRYAIMEAFEFENDELDQLDALVEAVITLTEEG